ncbi:MAG: hypothetical protein DRJ01_11545, partial [Bacteroidetes bacterium]
IEYKEKIEEMEKEEERESGRKGEREKEKESENEKKRREEQENRRMEEKEKGNKEKENRKQETPIRSYFSTGQAGREKYFTEFINIVLKLNNLNSSELYKKIVDLSIRFIDADRGFLLLYDEQGELQIEVARNKNGEELKVKSEELGVRSEEIGVRGEKLKEGITHNTINPKPYSQYQKLNFKFQISNLISHTVINKVVKERKPLFVSDITEVENIAKAQSITDMKLQSVMCIPLGRKLFKNDNIERRQRHFLTRSELLGILYVDSRHLTEESKFKGENLHLLQAIADQASFALINAILYEKANIDSLTKLYLRPYFEDCLKSEILFHEKQGSSFCILMIDIDFLKNINDNYGHNAGDYVLKTIGKIFNDTLRSSDICARYGGDEFSVILPNTNLTQGKQIAEKFLKTVSSYIFYPDISGITLSIGISVYPESAKGLQELLKKADEALYIAKVSGRNCCQIWQESYSFIKRSHITDILTGNPIRDYRNVEMLLQSIKVATSTLDLQKLIDRIVDTILEITSTERCILMMVNKRNELKIKSSRNNKGENLSKDLIYSRSVSQKVLKTGIPISQKNIKEDIATDSQLELNLRSVMCVPLQIKDKRFGVVYVDSQQVVRKFTEAELSIFAAIASQLALIIENTRLHEKAINAGKIKEQILEQKVNERTAELKETQKTLVEVAHRAGMAEIATGILHNVGNVLNSVKVSSQILKEKIERSKVNNLPKVLKLMQDHSEELGTYITSDEKGKMLPSYLIEVGKLLKDEQVSSLNEISNLSNGINHIEEIVAVQQNYSGVSGVVESISISKMMDDVLRMFHDSFNQYKIKVIKEYKVTAPISVEKGKLMQVFVNLLKNALESLIEKNDKNKTVTIRIKEEKNSQIFEIIDNGVGIPKENLERIFSYGYSTKKEGKGFGLHTSALTMTELKGKLTAESVGEGKGAKFTVVVPIQKK